MHTLESTQTSARTRTPSFCFIIRFDFIWYDCCVAVVICHYCAFRMPINSDNIRYKWIQNVSPIGLRFIQELPGIILSASAWVSIAEWILKIISSMVSMARAFFQNLKFLFKLSFRNNDDNNTIHACCYPGHWSKKLTQAKLFVHRKG